MPRTSCSSGAGAISGHGTNYFSDLTKQKLHFKSRKQAVDKLIYSGKTLYPCDWTERFKIVVPLMSLSSGKKCWLI